MEPLKPGTQGGFAVSAIKGQEQTGGEKMKPEEEEDWRWNGGHRIGICLLLSKACGGAGVRFLNLFL